MLTPSTSLTGEGICNVMAFSSTLLLGFPPFNVPMCLFLICFSPVLSIRQRSGGGVGIGSAILRDCSCPVLVSLIYAFHLAFLTLVFMMKPTCHTRYKVVGGGGVKSLLLTTFRILLFV